VDSSSAHPFLALLDHHGRPDYVALNDTYHRRLAERIRSDAAEPADDEIVAPMCDLALADGDGFREPDERLCDWFATGPALEAGGRSLRRGTPLRFDHGVGDRWANSADVAVYVVLDGDLRDATVGFGDGFWGGCHLDREEHASVG
jgi:hypothetical protein